MICGGKVSILLDPILPNSKMKNIFSSCLKKVNQQLSSAFITIYDNSKTSHYLINEKFELNNNFTLEKNEIKEIIKKTNNFSKSITIKSNNKIILISPIFTPSKVYLLGAGHVSQPTAMIASLVGFEVVVMDDRKDFANKKRFPTANEIKIINFNNINEIFDKNTFIVIITRGHIYDNVVLEQALKSRAKYIGMIGSFKKRDKIFDNLLKKGFSIQEISEVYSPIGINLNAETPEEIALSIVSEMVIVRTGIHKKRKLNTPFFLSNIQPYLK